MKLVKAAPGAIHSLKRSLFGVTFVVTYVVVVVFAVCLMWEEMGEWQEWREWREWREWPVTFHIFLLSATVWMLVNSAKAWTLFRFYQKIEAFQLPFGVNILKLLFEKDMNTKQ